MNNFEIDFSWNNIQQGRRRLKELHHQCKRSAMNTNRNRTKNQKTEDCLKLLENLEVKRWNQADKVPLAIPNRPKSPQKVKTYIKDHSNQMRKDASTFNHIKNQMKSHLSDIFRVRNLTTDTNPDQFYPTATQLH